MALLSPFSLYRTDNKFLTRRREEKLLHVSRKGVGQDMGIQPRHGYFVSVLCNNKAEEENDNKPHHRQHSLVAVMNGAKVLLISNRIKG